MCENTNSKIQSGKLKPIHGLPVKHVEFMGLAKRYTEPFIGCYPNISEGQIVFTQSRPQADTQNKVTGAFVSRNAIENHSAILQSCHLYLRMRYQPLLLRQIVHISLQIRIQ